MARVMREEFLNTLESIKPGLSARGVLEQSACIIFRDDKVITFNDEVSCAAPMVLDGCVGAVLANPLLSILHKLKED